MTKQELINYFNGIIVPNGQKNIDASKHRAAALGIINELFDKTDNLKVIIDTKADQQSLVNFINDMATVLVQKADKTTLDDYLKKVALAQSTGTATDNAMSQKATSDELAVKAKTTDLDNYVKKSTLAQSTGTATDNAMSQKAVSDELALKVPKTAIVQQTGTDANSAMSQKSVTDEFVAIKNERDIYNVTVKVPLPSGYYIADTARAAVPTAVRKLGLIIAYSIAANVWQTEQFIGTAVSGWTTGANWQKLPNQADLDSYVKKTSIVQTTGGATDNVMSQKATTDELSAIENRQDIYNVTVRVPLPSGYYTADTARAAVPTAVRKLGMMIAYSTVANVWQTEQFIGTAVSAWTTAANWQRTATQVDLNTIENARDAYNVTVKVPLATGYYTAATARAAVPTAVRKLGLIITYSVSSTVWKTEQFIGTAVSAWTIDSNWLPIASGSGGYMFLYEAGSVIPVVDVVNGTLDLGTDPVLIIGNKSFGLKSLWSSNPEKYRTIDLGGTTGQLARCLYFNTSTNEFIIKSYNDFTNLTDCILIGTLRYIGGVTGYRCNFPFSFKLSSDIPAFDKNVSLVASSENSADIPVVDVINKLLDLGANPILIIGNKSFDLKALWPSNPENYRAIPLTSSSVNNQRRVLYFNINTKMFEIVSYSGTAQLDANRVLIGTINNILSGTAIYQFNVNLAFPFKYTSTRASVITGSLKNRTNAKITLTRGLSLSGIAPENSLDSFEFAARAGYHGFECDINSTKDNELVVIHDDVLSSVTIRYAADYSEIPSGIAVKSLTLDDLRTNFVLASPNPRMRRPVPTVEEMFITCRDNHIKPFVELKNSISNELALKAYNLGKEICGDENFVIQCKGATPLDYIRTFSDTSELMYATASILGTVNSIDGQSREHPLNIWAQVPAMAEQVKEYHRKGMRVYTTAGVLNFDDVLRTGVDYIEAGDVGPDLSGRPGNVLTSDGNWKAFSTNGSIVSDYVLLNNGQWIKWDAKNAIYFSAFYVKVTFKGSISLAMPKGTAKKTSYLITSLIIQGLLVNSTNQLTLSATADGTEIYNIEFVSVDL